MLKTGSRGFTLLETSIATLIIFTVIAVSLPINSKLRTERKIMFDRREISYMLQQELLVHLNSAEKSKLNKQKLLNGKVINISSSFNDGVVTACGNWTNLKNKKEEKCVYAWN